MQMVKMTVGQFPLFLGLLLYISRCILVIARYPCTSYNFLNDSWRNTGYDYRNSGGISMCDYYMNGKWYRFSGAAGDVMPTDCVPEYHCGAAVPIWMNGTHPKESDGITEVEVCGHWDGKCCNQRSSVNVTLCPGGYYLYQLHSPFVFHFAFCTRHNTCTPSVCGPNAQCDDDTGSCICDPGFKSPGTYPPGSNGIFCVDINECDSTPSICGQNAKCNNTAGSYNCSCNIGYTPPPGITFTNNSYPCQDIDECSQPPQICGPKAQCNNTAGSYNCTCDSGYRAPPEVILTNISFPCQDIDECVQNSLICGLNTVCNNTEGSYDCSCEDEYIPSTGLKWTYGNTTCQSDKDAINATDCPLDQLKEICFLNKVRSEIDETTVSNEGIVKNYLNAVMSTIKRLSDEKDANASNAVLQTTEKLVSTLVPSTNKTAVNETILLNSLEARLIGGSEKTNILLLKSKANEMKINLTSIAKNNEGSAAVAFMSYTEMEELLSVEFFENGNQTEMISDVITATLPKTKTTNLSEPVNFTLKHTKSHLENGLLTCVYWKETVWSVKGCTATYSNETHTVCSCTHLSTFALIMQIDKEHEVDDLLAFINKIAVSINLVCLALAILTFSFCTWNPKINNTACLNLSICLFLAHFIFMLGSSHTENKMLCSAIAVILHYLFLGSFMWMYLEAIQIFLLVKSLKKVKVIQRQGLHYGYLLLIGYSTPAIIVGVSVGVFPNGYGNEKKCWLKNDNGFRWSFLGPVCYILATGVLLFVSTVWNLLTVLAHMKSKISKIRDTRLIVFKTLAQFVILGCSWILAFVPESPMFFYMFIFLNSQQGTFIFLVHCLLNKEVRKQYKKWFQYLWGKNKALTWNLQLLHCKPARKMSDPVRSTETHSSE
nr:PREDICTED: adhesion G protein-coupled receptor E1-like [Lepisosteus oculatus]